MVPYVDSLKKYADFKGRATRSEYWSFYFINVAITFVLSVLDGFLGTWDRSLTLGIISGLYSLAVLIPALALTFRRLHDTGRSAWWIFIAFIPLAGAILLLVWFLTDSDPGENKFGPNPKGIAAQLFPERESGAQS